MARYMYAILSERSYRVQEVPPSPPRQQQTGFSSNALQPLLDLQPATVSYLVLHPQPALSKPIKPQCLHELQVATRLSGRPAASHTPSA